MKTRIQKYRHYREKIAKTPEGKFPSRNHVELKQTSLDEQVIAQTGKASAALSYKHLSLKERKATPYYEYSKRERIWLIIKSVGLLVAVVGFVCLYFFWVKGA
ncbi:MAG: hypothetical protein LKF75_05250 [Bacilli bacterium]|jgi:hypothetical protein|nr:hypothetical protein [Bacilli bacterium]MCH4210941.1 hypothetical protein [Bacilli bacterium]MCH4229077.1 hypothetical protein [Bacilli bacterium]MCH4277771.1 hypothetical protein [Bacilli bacterium]MCI2054985.1 hypothetical protein [Bacilli bacterium]